MSAASKKRITLRAIAALSSAAALTQVVPVFSTPILSRLYSPADYGIVLAVTSLLGPLTKFAGLQLAPAMIVEPDEGDVDALLNIVLVAAVLAFGFSTLGALCQLGPLSEYVHVHGAALWHLVVLAGCLLSLGIFNAAVSALVNREKSYNLLALSRLLSALASTGVNIAMGLWGYGSWYGLLSGVLCGTFVQATLCAWGAKKYLLRALETFSIRRSLQALRKHKRYPVYILPSEVLNNFLSQAPVYALATFSTADAAGAYAMSQRMLGAPSTLISSAVGEVFVRGAAEEYAEKGECRDLFMRFLRVLSMISIAMFLLIALIGPDVFAFVLGARWRRAGEFVRILAPMMALKFVVGPLSYMYVVTRHQREDVLLHIVFGCIVFGAGFSAGGLGASAHGILGALSTASFLFYATCLVRSWMFATQKPARESQKGDPRVEEGSSSTAA